MNNKIKLFSFILLFSLILVSAEISEIPVYLQNSNIEIRHPIRFDGVIDGKAFVNISVTDPDNLVILGNSNMTFDPFTNQNNITIPSNSTSKLGNYGYCISASNTTNSDTECFIFEVSLTGKRASVSESIVYMMMAFLSIVFFLLSLYGSIKIPFKNSRSSQGFIVTINDLKYLKMILWVVTYMLLIFIMLSFSVVSKMSNWDVFYKIFYSAFWFLIVFLFPIFVIIFIIAVMNFYDDKKLRRLIDRNLKVR